MSVKLTPKETALLEILRKGMDEPGRGWLHEMVEPSRSVSGVLGSLVRKGLARSSKIVEKGMPTTYWVEVYDEPEPEAEAMPLISFHPMANQRPVSERRVDCLWPRG